MKRSGCILAQWCLMLTAASVCSAASIRNQYESMRGEFKRSYRDGVLDVFMTDEGLEKKRICHFAVFLPYSRIKGGERSPYPSNSYRQAATTIQLAVKHLNDGDGSVIPEVEGLDRTCDVGFVPKFYDTEASQSGSVRQFVDLLGHGEEDHPCYILGAALSSISVATAAISSHMGVVQLSPISSTPLLDSKDYPLFGRLRPSSRFGAAKTVEYFCDVLNSRHLGVIHADNALGNEFRTAMLDAAEKICPGLTIFTTDVSSTHHDTQGEISRAMRIMKDTEFKHFFAVIDRSVPYDILMETACNHSMAGTGDHLWMFSTGLGSLITRLEVEPGSCLHRASIGTGMISPHGGMPGQPEYDRFTKKWQSLNNPADIEFIQSRLPTYPNEPDYVPGEINNVTFKSISAPPLYAYDEVIAMGLAACRMMNKSADGGALDGETLFQEFVNSSFNGITGRIKVLEETGSRDADSAYYVVFNYREVPTEAGTIEFERVITHLLQDGTWTAVAPYIFSDNSTVPPLSIPANTIHFNYIGWPVRAGGLAMCGIVLFLSAGFALWSFLKRKTSVVVASQPFFLYIICAGTFLMGTTIIALSIDDEIVNESGCDVACATSPWLFQFGFTLVFAGLHSKTNRVNQIFRNPDMRRKEITVVDVIKPLCAIMVLNVIILSLWTAQNPAQFERTVVEEDRFGRPTESIGQCSYYGSLPYMITLAVIDIGSLIVAMWEAYVARDIATAFSESLYIANAMSSVFLVSVVGIPVIALTGEEPRAQFFVLSGIIFVICTALLFFIFAPKIYYYQTKSEAEVARAIKTSLRLHASSQSRNSFSRSLYGSAEFQTGRSEDFFRASGNSSGHLRPRPDEILRNSGGQSTSGRGGDDFFRGSGHSSGHLRPRPDEILRNSGGQPASGRPDDFFRGSGNSSGHLVLRPDDSLKNSGGQPTTELSGSLGKQSGKQSGNQPGHKFQEDSC